MQFELIPDKLQYDDLVLFLSIEFDKHRGFPFCGIMILKHYSGYLSLHPFYF